MNQGQQIKVEDVDLFESDDEEVQQYQDYFDVQEEVVVQECPEQEVITQSWDLNHASDIET